MTKALREVIIPHLFLNRTKQRITIRQSLIGTNNSKASKGVAVSLGFKKIKESTFGEEEYVLLRKNFRNKFPFKKIAGKMSEERLKVLKKRVYYTSKILCLIQSEFEMKFHEDAGLKKEIEKIKKYIWKLEDLWWENQRN